MDTRNASEGSPGDRPEVGKGGSFVVGCGIGFVLLVLVGSAVFVKARSRENERRARTAASLARTAARVRALATPPRADGTGADWTGFDALEAAAGKLERDDGWGNPFRYRSPGLLHRQGWDVWSCGPNAKDDSGTWDDLVAGEDVAGVTTAGR